MFLLAFPWPRFFKDFLLKLAQKMVQTKAEKAWKTILLVSPTMGNYLNIHSKIGSIVGGNSVDKLRAINSKAPQL